MVRGLWNLHVNGKWYRLCHPRGRISPPEAEVTFQLIMHLHDHPDSLNGWEVVPFPSPIHSNLDYVYTIDQDAGIFIISLRREFLTPSAIRIDLGMIYKSSGLFLTYMSFDKVRGLSPAPAGSLISGLLAMDFVYPTPMNELQERLFTDFVFLWRFYIDDPLAWRTNPTIFKVFCIAFLRLAAWDFELCFDGDSEKLPISLFSIPRWNYPTADMFWFHGFLVILQEDVESETTINEAVIKAKLYVSGSLGDHIVHLILMSPYHITFVRLSLDAILASKPLVLLSNSSAAQCSPGFRALTRILTSYCWKRPQAHRETWECALPPEIIQKILHALEARDVTAFSQASFTVEQCYYASLAQFNNTIVQSYKSSVPCCGKRGGLEEHGVCCSQCYSWHHLECVSLESWSSENHHICMGCEQGITCTALDPGGIHRLSRHKKREGFRVKVGGSEKLLQLRLSKPSHLRPELRLVGNLPIAPNLIDYTIRFNGAFCGLAYGLDDEPT